MNLKIALVSATALGMLMAAGTAFADPNTLYILQSGAGNQALVQQNAGPGGNDTGKAGAPVVQSGNNNAFSETQSLGGGFYRGDNDIKALSQVGDSNRFSSDYSNNSGGDRITSALQQGNLNLASVGNNGSVNGTITTFNQIGSSNSARVNQSGTGNTVTTLQQIGSNNGAAYGSGGPQNANQWGTSITQSGNYNVVSEASIIGSNNQPSSGPGPQSITQHGNDNGRSASVARTNGSNGNGILVDEEGDWNNFSVIQGTSAASTGNFATVSQLGNSNSATATQFGNYNHLVVDQKADGNSTVANFTGDSNGNGTMSGIAGALVSANSANLTEGTINQDSTGLLQGNLVTYNVTGSSNLFAIAQIGGGNKISGNVVNSSGNQAAILQTGNNNTTSFTQTGGGNNAISVSQ